MNGYFLKAIFIIILLACVQPAFALRGIRPEGDTQGTVWRQERKEISLPAETEPPHIQCAWYGHSFIHLTSSAGVRVAIDPFSESISLPFPKNVHADVVLVSYESDDRNAADRISGTPQIFRSITGAGANMASGIIFQGVETWRDSSQGKKLGKNITYAFQMDGVKFCHLGGIGYPLTSSERDQIGRVDVVFIPIGNKGLTVAELWEMVDRLEARWVVPIAFDGDTYGMKDLRKVQEFLNGRKAKIVRANHSFTFDHEHLPQETTVLILTDK